MLNNLKKKRKGKGFTLIELIIVIAIIAIISAIAIPKLLNSRDDANKKADIANAKTIANATATAITKGDITTVTGTAIAATEVVAVSGGTTAGNKVAAALQNVPTPKTATTKKFFVEIDGNSQIKVTIATTATTGIVEAFPNPDASLN